MSSDGTLQQYIILIERLHRTSQATALSALLDLHDEHVLNRKLICRDIVSYVEANCVAPLDEIVIAHLLCVRPFGIRTLGSWGPSAKIIYKEIAKRLIHSTRDQKAGLFFAQRISIAIQRGNAASLLDTLPVDIDGEEYFVT